MLVKQQQVLPARGRWTSTGPRTSLCLYSGSHSSSEQSATSSCWRSCCGVEADHRSALSCLSGLWPSLTSVWCSAQSGSRLTTSCKVAGNSASSSASYSAFGNFWRWTVLSGPWPLSRLIGIMYVYVIEIISKLQYQCVLVSISISSLKLLQFSCEMELFFIIVFLIFILCLRSRTLIGRGIKVTEVTEICEWKNDWKWLSFVCA